MIHCDCSTESFDRPKVCTVKDVRARKQHSCCECGRTIERRETYELVKGLWDGRWETYKTCLGCTRIRDHFCSDGFIYTALAELVSECIGFDYTADDDEDDCDAPCQYPGCDECRDYWLRMVAEGRWEPGRGWTDKGLGLRR